MTHEAADHQVTDKCANQNDATGVGRGPQKTDEHKDVGQPAAAQSPELVGDQPTDEDEQNQPRQIETLAQGQGTQTKQHTLGKQIHD